MLSGYRSDGVSHDRLREIAMDAADPREHAEKLIKAYGKSEAVKMAKANLQSNEGAWWAKVLAALNQPARGM